MASCKVSRHASAVVTGARSGTGCAFAIEIAQRKSRLVCSNIEGRAYRCVAIEDRRQPDVWDGRADRTGGQGRARRAGRRPALCAATG